MATTFPAPTPHPHPHPHPHPPPRFRLPHSHRHLFYLPSFSSPPLSKLQFNTTRITSPPRVSTITSVITDKFDWYSEWYAVSPVCDLDKRVPHGGRILGIDLVVWWDRNEGGQCQWKVFEDCCPHRLAPLSEGRIDSWGRLQCWFLSAHPSSPSRRASCSHIQESMRCFLPLHPPKWHSVVLAQFPSPTPRHSHHKETALYP